MILHSCHIKKDALIGMGSIILDGAEIGEGAFIGAGSLVSQGKKIPPNTLAFGRPAKVVRELTEEDRKDMERIRTQYVEKGQYYKSLQNDFTAAIILAVFYIKSNFSLQNIITPSTKSY